MPNQIIATATIGTITDEISALFSSAMDMAGTVGTTVVGSPLLLTFTVVPLVGLGVGLFKRLINIR